jgi:hypothetical protein
MDENRNSRDPKMTTDHFEELELILLVLGMGEDRCRQFHRDHDPHRLDHRKLVQDLCMYVDEFLLQSHRSVNMLTMLTTLSSYREWYNLRLLFLIQNSLCHHFGVEDCCIPEFDTDKCQDYRCFQKSAASENVYDCLQFQRCHEGKVPKRSRHSNHHQQDQSVPDN